MTWTRYLVLALGVLAAVGATVGTGGFSAVNADRSVSVSVVEFDPDPHGLDEDGYLGIEVLAEDEREATDDLEILYLVNQFPGRLTDVTVTVAGGADTTVAPYARQDLLPLDPGENTVVGATCDGPTGGWVTLPLEITASGPGVRVTKHLDVEVRCKEVTPTSTPSS